MTDEAWESAGSNTVQVFLNGAGILVPDERGDPILDDTFLIIFHAHPEPRTVTLPERKWGERWRRVLDTVRGFAEPTDEHRFVDAAAIEIAPRSLWLLVREVPR